MKKILFLLAMVFITFGCVQNKIASEETAHEWTLKEEATERLKTAFRDKMNRTDLVLSDGGIVFQSGDSIIVISQMVSYSSDKIPKMESYEYVYYKMCDSISYEYINDIKESNGTTMQILDYEIKKFNKFVLENGGKEVSFEFIAPKRLAALAIIHGKGLNTKEAEQ